MTEVTCAIIIEMDRVLVTQRSEHMPHPLKWEFPGGKLKVGESPEYCIKREIFEELGIRVAVNQLLPSVKYNYDTHTVKLIPFICSVKEGKISLSEHKSFRWISMESLEAVDWLDADVEVVRIFKTRMEGKP
jgi:8-oxo-dGTP diphosphatase